MVMGLLVTVLATIPVQNFEGYTLMSTWKDYMI